MALELPESMDELVYWTNRTIGDGKVTCWVERQECPKCHKALMGKPRGDNGKIKVRAKEYVCPECGNTAEKQEYEDTLTASCIYTCPECKKKGDVQVPFQRKSIQGVQTLRINCEFCNANIDITKKMKEKKGK